MALALSHVALTVGRSEGPLAARLLGHLGLQVTDNGPSLVGDPWYTALVDPDAYRGDMAHLGFFVVPVSDAQVALEAAVRPAIAALPERERFLADRAGKPDSNSHVALNFASLEALEEAVRALRADDQLAGRVSVATIRPAEPATAAIAERLDASDVFAGATPVRYVTTGVQAFAQTDIVTTGLLCLGQSFELNFAFASSS